MGTRDVTGYLARCATALSGAKASEVKETNSLGTKMLCPGFWQARFKVIGRILRKSRLVSEGELRDSVVVIISYFTAEEGDPEFYQVILRFQDDSLVTETNDITHLVRAYTGREILSACEWGHFAPAVRDTVAPGTYFYVRGSYKVPLGHTSEELRVTKGGGYVTTTPPVSPGERRFSFDSDPRSMVRAYLAALGELRARDLLLLADPL